MNEKFERLLEASNGMFYIMRKIMRTLLVYTAPFCKACGISAYSLSEAHSQIMQGLRI